MFIALGKAWEKAPPKEGQYSFLITEAKTFVEMVRISDKYKYLRKMPGDYSIHPPTCVTIPSLDKKHEGLMEDR